LSLTWLVDCPDFDVVFQFEAGPVDTFEDFVAGSFGGDRQLISPIVLSKSSERKSKSLVRFPRPIFLAGPPIFLPIKLGLADLDGAFAGGGRVLGLSGDRLNQSLFANFVVSYRRAFEAPVFRTL
jgi:hypothetical protein